MVDPVTLSAVGPVDFHVASAVVETHSVSTFLSLIFVFEKSRLGVDPACHSTMGVEDGLESLVIFEGHDVFRRSAAS